MRRKNLRSSGYKCYRKEYTKDFVRWHMEVLRTKVVNILSCNPEYQNIKSKSICTQYYIPETIFKIRIKTELLYFIAEKLEIQIY